MDETEKKFYVDSIRDSIYHALEHYSSVENIRSDFEQNSKWIVLSIHHATETYLKYLLKIYDKNNRLFSRERPDGSPYYPSAQDCIRELSKITLNFESEKIFLNIATNITKLRDQIVHNPFHYKSDISWSSWGTLALLREVSLKFGLRTEEILDQTPTIETSIVLMMNWEHQKEYIGYVETVLAEQDPDEHFDGCDLCGANAIKERRCEGCFEEMKKFECSSCGYHFFLPINKEYRQDDPKCAECGFSQNQHLG